MAHQHYPWRSKTEKEVPPGFKFTPTEEQLIDHYLIPQALGMPIPGDHVVEEKVYEKAPWELLGPHRDNRYLFTTRTMHGNRVKRTVGAKGTWSVTASGIPIQSADGKIIGLKTKLSYCVVNKKSTGYTMDEYKLTPQSVTSSYMPEEEAPSQELVLCCVRRVQRGDSKKRQAEEEAAVAVVSSEQAHHDRTFEIGAVVVAAAEGITFSPENAAAAGSFPLSAAEASLEGRAHTEAINYASTDQTMSSSAIDQQLPPCSDNCRMEMFNNDIFYPSEAYELDMIPAEVVATAEHHSPPLSGQDGDQPTASAIYTGQPGSPKLSNLRYSPSLPEFDWETWLRTDSSDVPYLDVLLSPDLLESPPESALAGVAASAAADCSATPPMYLPAAAEASLEGRVNTETINHASTDQIMLSSAFNLQPPAYNDGYRMEEMINADISETWEGYELEMTTAEVATTSEHHLPPPSGQDGDQPTATATSAAEFEGE